MTQRTTAWVHMHRHIMVKFRQRARRLTYTELVTASSTHTCFDTLESLTGKFRRRARLAFRLPSIYVEIKLVHLWAAEPDERAEADAKTDNSQLRRYPALVMLQWPNRNKWHLKLCSVVTGKVCCCRRNRKVKRSPSDKCVRNVREATLLSFLAFFGIGLLQ